jgi:hypothetical protein
MLSPVLAAEERAAEATRRSIVSWGVNGPATALGPFRPKRWQVDLLRRLREALLWAASDEPKALRIILIDAPQQQGKTAAVQLAISWAMAELGLSAGLLCYDFGKLAKPHSRTIKRQLAHPHAKIAWPHLERPIPLASKVDEAGHWNVPHKDPDRAPVEFIATGRGGGFEGLMLGMVVIDDLYKSLSDAASLANNAAVEDLLTTSVIGRVATRGGLIVDIGTRRGARDTKGFWLRKAAELSAAGLPPMVERWSYPLRGSETWRYGPEGYLTPDWYPDKERATRLAMGLGAARVLLDGEDIDTVGDVFDFDGHLAHYYDGEPSEVAALCSSTALSIDTAETEGGGDWTVIFWLGEFRGDVVVLGAWRGQWGTLGVVEQINTAIEVTGAAVAYIENASSGKTAVAILSSVVKCTIVPVNVSGHGSKLARIRATLPIFALGKVRWPRATCREDVSWCYRLDAASRDVRARLAAIRGDREDLAGQVDDEADALTIYLRQRVHAAPSKEPRPSQVRNLLTAIRGR